LNRTPFTSQKQPIPKDELRNIGERLRAAGFDDGRIAANLGLTRLGQPRAADLPVYLRRLDDTGPLAVLVPFLLFGEPTDRHFLDPILGSGNIDALAESQFVEIDGDRVTPAVRLTPFKGLVFAHDPESGVQVRPDHVAGIGPAPKTLHSLTIREPIARALDIGTGGGVQALFLARHADHVVGTDVNPRALWFAACNAALNGIDNVEWREGSLFVPVAGETFDLIIANPPFVQSPDTTYIFRDGGIPGNICEVLLADAADYLEPGGYAQSLISWAVGDDGDWESGPRGWLAGTGCDGWLLHYQSEDGLDYASKWNAWLRDSDLDAYASTLDRWTAHYTAQGTSALATGAITIRRRDTDTPWWYASHMTHGPQGDAGGQTLRVFKAHDAMASLGSNASLRAAVPRFSDDHRLDQRMRYRGGAYSVEATQIIPDNSVGVAADIDAQALLVVLSIDGERSLEDLTDEASDGMTSDETARWSDVVLKTIRELALLGIIELAR
jgi:methylase of polypeptide subunit release factors